MFEDLSHFCLLEGVDVVEQGDSNTCSIEHISHNYAVLGNTFTCFVFKEGFYDLTVWDIALPCWRNDRTVGHRSKKDRQTDRQAGMQAGRQAGRQIYRSKEILGNKQTNKQTNQ